MADLYENPTTPIDNWGSILPSYTSKSDYLRLNEQPGHIITVDSRNRNRSVFPNANNFRVQLQYPLKGVYSVELLNAIIPIPNTDPDITERYVTIRSSALQVCEPAQASNPNQNSFGVSYYSSNLDEAFAVIPLIPNFPRAYSGGNDAMAVQATHWKRSECRIIKRFFPLKSELRYLDFELVLRNNTNGFVPYPFTNENPDPEVATNPENNIVLQLEIVSKT